MDTESTGALARPPSGEAAIPCPEGIGDRREGPYRVSFARTASDLERVQRLRFEVFNVELGEGLESSWSTGLDADAFDGVCHHLLLEDTRSGGLVGTYRMQTPLMARGELGLYCAQEFDLSGLPPEVAEGSIEVGRACIAKEHRNGTALFALWRGLASYLDWADASMLFGCCSLTSVEPRDGARMLAHLRRGGHVTDTVLVHPRPECACDVDESEIDPRELEAVVVPRLFATYLRYGARVLGPPAIDRDFKTIDFFILLDVRGFGRRLRDMFFAGLPGIVGRRRPSIVE